MAVVTDTSYGAGNVRTVAVVVHRVTVAVDEIVPMDVVDKPVAIVVDVITRNLAGIGPDVGRQVRVRVIHPRINDSHDNSGTAGGDIPCLRGIDVSIRRAETLPGIVQSPELGEVGIVRQRVNCQRDVRLKVRDVRIAFEPLPYSISICDIRLDKDLSHHAQPANDIETLSTMGEQVASV